MSSTPAHSAVIAWLIQALDLAEITGVWLYGSFCHITTYAADVDVMVRFKRGWAEGAAKFRGKIEQEFEEEFALPLHAIFLSDDEFLIEADFLSVLLADSRHLR